MEWVGGPRRVGAVTGFVGVGRPAPGVGRPWGAASGLSVDDGATGGVGVLPRAPAPGQVVEAGAGGLPAKWLPGAGCPADGPHTSQGIPVPGGSPGRAERIFGVGGLHARVPAVPLSHVRSRGRVVPGGAQAAGRGTRPHEGVDPVTVVLHYVCTKHQGGVGRTSSDCPRDHDFRWPDGPHRAGRTRSEAWMGGGGGGPGAGVGGGVFRDPGVRSGMGGQGGLCRLFLRCGADCFGVILGDRHELGNNLL